MKSIIIAMLILSQSIVASAESAGQKVYVKAGTKFLHARAITGFRTGCHAYQVKLTHSFADLRFTPNTKVKLLADKDTFYGGYSHIFKTLKERLDEESMQKVLRALSPPSNELPDPHVNICQAEMPILGDVFINVAGFQGQEINVVFPAEWIKVEFTLLKAVN